ncbi:MAG TPA: hypothetical protein VI423_09945 [Paenisporosarcina sp.]|nr:hypothetical protein [Paenisporosarcina sp.]
MKCSIKLDRIGVYCTRCANDQAARHDPIKQSKYVSTRREHAKANNLCIVCCIRPVLGTILSCAVCRKRHSENTIKNGDKKSVLITRMWQGAKRRAIKLNLPFNLEISDIDLPEKCPILGVDLKKGIGKLHSNSPTLDRVVPEIGYVKGNVKVISHRANMLKSNATLDVILKLADYIKSNSNGVL